MTDRISIIAALRAAGVECYTRSEWGSPREADGSYARRRGTHPMPDGPADYHFLHITVTRDSDTIREGKAGALQVEGYGYSTPPMVSYQDIVTNEGRYFEGQSYGVKGTHTVNDKNVPGFPEDLNRYGYATALMQNVDDAVTDVQVDVVAKIFAARELAGLVRRGAPIYPHRKFAWKACPGDLAVARLDEIERLRDHYVSTGLEGDDMAWNEDIPRWHPGDTDAKDKLTAADQLKQARGFAQEAYRAARRADIRSERLEKAMTALASGLGDEVAAAVREALADAVVDVDVNVTGGSSSE